MRPMLLLVLKIDFHKYQGRFWFQKYPVEEFWMHQQQQENIPYIACGKLIFLQKIQKILCRKYNSFCFWLLKMPAERLMESSHKIFWSAMVFRFVKKHPYVQATPKSISESQYHVAGKIFFSESMPANEFGII